MGCAQSTRVKEVAQPLELTAHEKLLARNQLFERKERANRPVFVQVEQPPSRPPTGDEEFHKSETQRPGSHDSPHTAARSPSLADGSDSPLPSWRSGSDADLVCKAGTLSLYTQDTGTWETAFFELAQWSETGRFCLRYKRFRGDERWRQCWRLSNSTEVRRGAQKSTLSMRERMSDACPSGIITVTALESRDQGGQNLGSNKEGALDEVLVGTRYELTIDEWADRIEELAAQPSVIDSDLPDEERPASPPTVSPMGATPARAREPDVVTVEDLSMASPTSLESPIQSHSGGDASLASRSAPLVPRSISVSPPALAPPLPPAPPGAMDKSGLAIRSGVAARRRAMGGGLNPEREWNPRDRDFDPFADKVAQTNANLGAPSPRYKLYRVLIQGLHQMRFCLRGLIETLGCHFAAASALAELGGLPSSDGRVYGVGGNVVLPVMENFGLDPDTSDDELSSVGGGSDDDNDGWRGSSSTSMSGIAPGRSAALAKRQSGGLQTEIVAGMDAMDATGNNRRKQRGRGIGPTWDNGEDADASRDRSSRPTRMGMDLPDLPVSSSSHASVSSFPKIS